jgi:uncharacterized protein (TIGR02996 family)
MSRQSEEMAFWTAINVAPDDDLPKLLFADWLADRDDQRAACLRWMVAEHKRPAFDSIDTKTWDWWSRTPAQPVHYQSSPDQYLLPLNLFTRMIPRGPGLWKGSNCFEEAVGRVCVAWLDCLRDRADPFLDDRPLPMPLGLAPIGSAGQNA